MKTEFVLGKREYALVDALVTVLSDIRAELSAINEKLLTREELVVSMLAAGASTRANDINLTALIASARVVLEDRS